MLSGEIFWEIKVQQESYPSQTQITSGISSPISCWQANSDEKNRLE
jgi:hypothetical protein